MDKHAVISLLGNPIDEGYTVDSSGKNLGSWLSYSYPYWWQKFCHWAFDRHAITVNGYPRIEHAPQCQLFFKKIDTREVLESFSRGIHGALGVVAQIKTVRDSQIKPV